MYYNILDLFLTNNPTLVDTVSVEPGISEHETIIAVVKLRPTMLKVKPRTVHIYSKAEWESMRHEMQNFSHPFYLPVNVKAQNNYGRSLKVRLIKLLGLMSSLKLSEARKTCHVKASL